MKKTMRFLSLAALALVGAIMTGCSNEDDFTVEPENKSNVVTLTTTVGIGGGAETRALTAEGTKTFAAGETMAIIYKNNNNETVKAVSAALTAGDIQSGNKTATFTFELTDPDKTQNVTYIYPAAMAGTTGVNYSALNSQNGTLATLASNLDLATYSGAWNAGKLPTGTLTNQLAILAITLKNNAATPAEITSSITNMTISDGTNTYTVSRSAAAGPIYVAIRPTASANIEVTATAGSTDYTKSLTGKTYEASNGYNVSWRMAPALNLTSPAVGQVIGSDGKNYAAGSVPTGVTAVAKICYVSGSNGLALALTDEGKMIWSTAISTCAAHTPAFTGGTWKLATQDEWNNMITAAGGYGTLRDGFSSVGGSNLQEGVYWSSTEDTEKNNDSWHAWSYNFVLGSWGSDHKAYDDAIWARACLAW